MMLYREGDGFWQPQDPLPFQRESRAAEISKGMKPEEVLGKIGAPDFIILSAAETQAEAICIGKITSRLPRIVRAV